MPATSSKVTRPWLLGQKLRLGLAEAHGLAAAGLHLAHEEDPHADQQQHREPGDQDAEERRHIVVGRLRRDLHTLLMQLIDEPGIVRGISLEGAPIGEMAGDLAAGDGHILDAAALDLSKQLREADVGAPHLNARALKQIEQGNKKKADKDPDGEITKVRIHLRS